MGRELRTLSLKRAPPKDKLAYESKGSTLRPITVGNTIFEDDYAKGKQLDKGEEVHRMSYDDFIEEYILPGADNEERIQYYKGNLGFDDDYVKEIADHNKIEIKDFAKGGITETRVYAIDPYELYGIKKESQSANR